MCWGSTASNITPSVAGHDSVEGGVDPEFCAVVSGRAWCSDTKGQVLPGVDMLVEQKQITAR